MWSCVINSKPGNINTIPCSRLIIVVLMWTPLIRALEEVRGPINDEHMVFSSTLTFNINNIKMRSIAAKDNIKLRIEI